ncbi:MAG: acetylornithine deacetylase [Sandaracinaceae bacterium]|nr:acetylornithine deacetylase [Sandaracinaceae bacterium]
MPSTEGLAAVVDEVRRLVAFRSITRGPNRDLIEDVRHRLDALGAPCHLTWDDTKTKANLFASFGPTDRPGVVLSGHTDVVPVDGQDWSHDPFDVVERDGKLFGRGTVDMKAFLAVPLAMAPQIAARDLKRPLHVALSYDEEIGCVGVHRMLAELSRYAATPAACIVGEPTGMKVITGHKGKRVLRCLVRGVAGHSSRPAEGVNAIEHAAELIAHARAVAKRVLAEGPFADAFDPPTTTMQTGKIRGGLAVNIIPAECVFELEIRFLPGDDPDALIDELTRFAREHVEPEMRALDPSAGFTFEEVVRYPALSTGPEAEVVALAQRLTGETETSAVGFGSEAGLFSLAGVPSIVCGPGGIGEAHRPDEFIELGELARCQRFVERLLDELCA